MKPDEITRNKINHINEVVPARFQELALLWEASVRATHDFLSEQDIAVLRPKILHEYLPVLAVRAYYDEEDKILGFVAVAADKVEMLFVLPDARGLGIGKALLHYAVTQMLVNKLDVNEQNSDAVGFYQYMGWKVTGYSPKDSLGKPFPLLHMTLD